jgi:hypothetical protein
MFWQMGRVWVTSPNIYPFLRLKMKENVHNLEILEQLSEAKSNVKMQKSIFLIHP